MSPAPSHKEIACAEVQAKLESGRPVRIVDVRQPWEYERRHIPGVLLLPTDEFASRFAAELDSTEEIICVCEHGIRSAAAARYLAAQGYANVATMTGGMAEYNGAVEAGAGGNVMKMLTKEEAAAEIAEAHYEIDEDTVAIYWILAADEDAPEEPLKLLKVSADTPPMGVLPLHFPPKISEGRDFAHELTVVTPEEFDDMTSGRLLLPEGWRLGQMIAGPQRVAEAVA